MKIHTIPEEHWFIASIFLLGLFLRLLYTFQTPHTVREHDVDGHIEYIEYVVDHFTIPATIDGWEFYQPPSYYFLSALHYGIADMLGIAREDILVMLQYDSVIFSMLTLVFGMGAAFVLFPKKSQRTTFYAFSLLLATFPGLIYLAARINNDTFFALVASLWFLLFLLWWKDGSMKHWLWLNLCIAFGILTKSNSLLFLPIVYGCLLFFPKWSFGKKVRNGCIGLLLVAILSGWYPVYRSVIDTRAAQAVLQTDSIGAALVPNLTNLNGALRVNNNRWSYLTFVPAEIIRHPINNAWDDIHRREFFFEFLFRSMFVGAFDVAPELRLAAQEMQGAGLVLLAFSLAGFLGNFITKRAYAFPLGMTAFIVLFGHTAFRFSVPYSSAQDYRYSPLLVYPFLFFALSSMEFLPKWLRHTCMFFCLVLAFVSACFVVSLR